MIVLVLLLALLVVAPNAAAAERGRAVVGGGSFGSAPTLRPGNYRDTILPSEFLYYAVYIGPGQQLRVTANSYDTDINRFLSTGLIEVTVDLRTPTGPGADRAPNRDSQGYFRVEDEDDADIAWVGPRSSPDTRPQGAWTGPGVYYLTFLGLYAGSGQPPRTEIPFQFTVHVDGPPATPPTPTPSPTAQATPAPPKPPDPSGPAPEVAALAGVGGLLLGVFAGIVRRIRTNG